MWLISFCWTIKPSRYSTSFLTFRLAMSWTEQAYLSSAYSPVAMAMSLSTKPIVLSKFICSYSTARFSFLSWSSSLIKISVCCLSSLILCKQSFSKCCFSICKCFQYMRIINVCICIIINKGGVNFFVLLLKNIICYHCFQEQEHKWHMFREKYFQSLRLSLDL